MRLKSIEVQLYRNFVDSGKIEVDDSITCLVGKNESGKTGVLQALYSLNPAFPSQVEVDIVRDYPRWRKVRDERATDLASVAPIQATFDLDEIDLAMLQAAVSLPLPKSAVVCAERTYGGLLRTKLLAPEDADWVQALVDSSELASDQKAPLREMDSLDALSTALTEPIASADRRTKARQHLQNLSEAVEELRSRLADGWPDSLRLAVEKRLPTFFYFSDLSGLHGRIDLTVLLAKEPNELTTDEQTAVALLRLAGVSGRELIDEQFEVRIAELEAAASEITRQVFEYWSQNRDLQVQFQIDSETQTAPKGGQTVVHRYLDIRLNDLRHYMTTNFATRSSGFQWFFSFIVAFSEYESKANVIILLDEPGLGLHARAQEDLLRFIEERLAVGRQVIYTNHSPFMLNPRQLQRARLVEDLTTRENPDVGAKVSKEALSVRPDTLFPLQAALGYDLAQNLFVGANNLTVEGSADLIYLTVLSDVARETGRRSLDARITIVPVGGADKIPTFVALLGAHVDASVLVDAGAGGQRLQDMINDGLLEQERLISVGQVTGKRDSSIEDLFTDDEYVRLYNEAFGASVDPASLKGTDSVLRRLERVTDGKFDHLRPATVILRNSADVLRYVSDATLERFEKLFEMINATFPE